MNKTKIRFLNVIIIFFCFLFFNKNVSANEICGNSRSEEAYKNGILNLDKNLYNKARINFETALVYDPNCVKANYQLGITYNNLILYQDSAILKFKKVQELVRDKKTQFYFDAIYNEGVAYQKMGVYKKSINAFMKVLELDPAYKDLDKLYNYLGVAYYFLDDYKSAVKQFKKAVKNNPGYREAKFNIKNLAERLMHYNLGVSYNDAGNNNEAIKEFIKAIEIDNDYYDAHLELGNVYIAEKRYEDAMNELTWCEKDNSNHHNIYRVYIGLGNLYFKQAKNELAIEYLKKALNKDPDSIEAKKILNKVYDNYKTNSD